MNFWAVPVINSEPCLQKYTKTEKNRILQFDNNETYSFYVWWGIKTIAAMLGRYRQLVLIPKYGVLIPKYRGRTNV